MVVLVTGGGGFIGRHVVARLIKDGHDVRVLDLRPRDTTMGSSPLRVDWHLGDIRNLDACQRAVQGVEAVVHLAAKAGVTDSIMDPTDSFAVNALGTLNLLRAAVDTDVHRFVFASSGAVLGHYTPPADEATLARPTSPYGASKLAAEAYCLAFHGSYGLRTVVLRFSNIYGPESLHKDSVVAAFCRQAIHEGTLRVHGDGSQIRDFLYVDDLVDGVIASLIGEQITGIFHLASGRSASVGKVARLIQQLYEHDRQRRLPITHVEPRRGDVPASGFLIERARASLGFQPTTRLAEGIARTWEWFATHVTLT